MNKISLLRRYGLAAIACGIALIVARPLHAESSSFVLAIIASSLFGGRGPGLLAVGLSGVIGDSGHRKKRQEPERPDLVPISRGRGGRKRGVEIHNPPRAESGVGGGHSSGEAE